MANKYAKYSLNKNPYKEAKRVTGSHHKLYYSCIKKKKYLSEKLANKIIAEALEARGVELRAYDCDFCGHIHLTKKLKKDINGS